MQFGAQRFRRDPRIVSQERWLQDDTMGFVYTCHDRVVMTSSGPGREKPKSLKWTHLATVGRAYTIRVFATAGFVIIGWHVVCNVVCWCDSTHKSGISFALPLAYTRHSHELIIACTSYLAEKDIKPMWTSTFFLPTINLSKYTLDIERIYPLKKMSKLILSIWCLPIIHL